MKINHEFLIVLLWSLATDRSDAFRQCDSYGDCGAIHYCLHSYCEPCIPCKDMFNRQPAQSITGKTICAKHEDDCGPCLPGYQAEDLAQQRRTMRCFRLPETGDPLPGLVPCLAVIMTILLATVILRFCGAYIKRKFAGRKKIPSDVHDSLPATGADAEALITDGLPTYEEAVNNLPQDSNTNVNKDVSVTDGQDRDCELNAESDSTITNSSVVEPDISTPVMSTDSVSNQLMGMVFPTIRICDEHPPVESAASSNEAQVKDAEVLQPRRSSCNTITHKVIVNHQIPSLSESELSVGNQATCVTPQSSFTSSLGPGRIGNKIEIAPPATSLTLESYQHRHGSTEDIEEKTRLTRAKKYVLRAISKFKRTHVKWLVIRFAAWKSYIN
ncbi:uncharacterized protein LOC130700190 [Daphnia carinata]|uniref:uncharacterized protein LOC130700190 n=1 Tax=Daphnia carinata TaxID=120202 RepID=UPI00257BC186|nr:uncharacterized protein LOC130700190 [Daphnia carinata]XP_057378194.1 uncharacterized protein LOC130700190 [Daphnia carinata]